MVKIGNLFELAEKQLQNEKRAGIIPCYTMQDIIEYAVQIRKFLDKNKGKINSLTKLSKVEQRRLRNIKRMERYLKTGK